MKTTGKIFPNALVMSTYMNETSQKAIWAGVIDGEIHAVFEIKEQPKNKKKKKKED